MTLRSLREFVFLPSSPEYLVPWLLGLSASLFVGVFGLAGIKAPDLPVGSMSLTALLVRLGSVAVFDGVLLWTHLRPFHLTWKTGRRRFWYSFLILCAAYLIAWGIVMTMQGKATIAVLGGAPFDMPTTLNDATAGLVGFALALLVPSWWKGEEPGVGNVRREREHVLAILEQVAARKVTAGEYRTFAPALVNLTSSAGALLARLDTTSDRELLFKWQNAAAQLQKRFATLSYEQAAQSADRGYGPEERASHAQLKENG